MLYIIAATLLYVFDVRPPLDEHGHPIKIELQQSHGFLPYAPLVFVLAWIR